MKSDRTKNIYPLPETKDEAIHENARLRIENKLLRDLLDYHRIKIPESIDKYLTNEFDLGIGGIAAMAAEISSLNSYVMMCNELIVKLIMK